MGHPQLWWLLIAPRRDAQTFAVQKPRNEAIKQLILCPTIYVTSKWTMVFNKNEQDNLTETQKKTLSNLIRELREEGR